MISAADILQMQTTTLATMRTPSQISRVTRVSDGMGGVSEVWTVIASPLCRLMPYRRPVFEAFVEERLGVATRWLIYFPPGTDVNEKDRILALGNTYEVGSVEAPASIELERNTICYLVL